MSAVEETGHKWVTTSTSKTYWCNCNRCTDRGNNMSKMVVLQFKEGTSNKIWGYRTMADNTISFWGRTGGTLTFKVYRRWYEAEQVAWTKRRKGYNDVVVAQRDQVLPTDFEGQLMLAALGQVKFPLAV